MTQPNQTVIVSGWLDWLPGSTNPQHVFSLDSRSRTRTEWVLKGYIDQRFAITEMLAAHVAGAIGVDVPRHHPIFLPPQLIDDVKELRDAGFLPGYHVGVEFQAGYDLENLQDSPSVEKAVMERMDVPRAAHQAAGLVVADTALCNADHHPGSGNRPANVSGNVSNIYFAETGAGYEMRALDFGASMNHAMWGEGEVGDWPDEVFGTLKFFFQRQWLAYTYKAMGNRFVEFESRLAALDVPLLVQEVLATLPQQWRVSNPGVEAGATRGNLTQSDWNDLIQRLIRHQGLTPSTIKSKFDRVGSQMFGVTQR